MFSDQSMMKFKDLEVRILVSFPSNLLAIYLWTKWVKNPSKAAMWQDRGK